MITSIQNGLAGEPQLFSLGQNYPNPFNPNTVINYQLVENSFVRLKVYDILGREVKSLVNERQTAGSHNVTFSASNLPSGVYFYRLSAGSSEGVLRDLTGQAGTFTQAKKMILTK
ncbi:MAG TPA: T9SS type A sorting domain-containing protein [Candidatus Kryptonia bacterium]